MTLIQQIAAIDHALSKPLTEESRAALQSLAGRIRALSAGAPRKLRPCPKCGVLCGARELKYEHCCTEKN